MSEIMVVMLMRSSLMDSDLVGLSGTCYPDWVWRRFSKDWDSLDFLTAPRSKESVITVVAWMPFSFLTIPFLFLV